MFTTILLSLAFTGFVALTISLTAAEEFEGSLICTIISIVLFLAISPTSTIVETTSVPISPNRVVIVESPIDSPSIIIADELYIPEPSYELISKLRNNTVTFALVTEVRSINVTWDSRKHGEIKAIENDTNKVIPFKYVSVKNQ